jgi:hypothetical protein
VVCAYLKSGWFCWLFLIGNGTIVIYLNQQVLQDAHCSLTACPFSALISLLASRWLSLFLMRAVAVPFYNNCFRRVLEGMNFTNQILSLECYSSADIVRKCKKYP